MTVRPASDQARSSDKITHSSRTRFRIVSQDMVQQHSVEWRVSPARRAPYNGAVPTSPSAPPQGMRLGSHVVLAEVGLTLLEALLVSAPAVALAGKSIAASGEAPRFLPLLGAVLFVSWVRSDYSLRPVIAARNAKERG